MEREYQEFIKAFREALAVVTGYGEERICFTEKGMRPGMDNDKLWIDSMGQQGCVRTVLSIDAELAFEMFRKGTRISELTQEAVCAMREAARAGLAQKVGKVESYEMVKDSLMVRLVNAEAERLNTAVYRRTGDITLVLFQFLGRMENSLFNMKIPRMIVRKWNMDEESVLQEALENTARMFPPRIYNLWKMVLDMNYTGDNFMDPRYKIGEAKLGICLSTTVRTNGAVALFYPGVAKRLGQLFGCGFYAVFTSIHEVMLHREKGLTPDDLKEVLEETVREATPKEDFLTRQIYHYDREKEIFSLVAMDPGEREGHPQGDRKSIESRALYEIGISPEERDGHSKNDMHCKDKGDTSQDSIHPCGNGRPAGNTEESEE